MTMPESDTPTLEALRRIADALGVPVEQFFSASSPVGADECLHLLFRIRTEAGRKRALGALRAIVDEETEAVE